MEVKLSVFATFFQRDEDFDDVVEESGLSVGAGGEGGGGEAAADGPSGGEEGVPLDEGGEKKK